MKKLFKIVLLSLMILSLVACSSNEKPAIDNSETGSTELADEQIFKVNLANPTSLDPAIYLDSDSGQIVAWTQETLLRNSDNEKYAPGLAETMDVSEDQLTYTFHLREGMTWENGEPITADDVVFSFQRIVDPVTASPNASIGYVFKNGEAVNKGTASMDEYGVKALDDLTVEVTLEKPVPFFIEQTISPKLSVVNKKAVTEMGEMYGTGTGKTVASGPFKLESWEQDYMVTLVKNDNYWNAENALIDKVEITMAKDANTIVSMYQTGQLSVLDVTADYRPQFENEKNYKTIGIPGVSFIEFSPKTEYVSNAKIREALGLTFDRAYYNEIMGGTTYPAEGLVPFGITGKNGQSYRDTYGKMVNDISTDESLKDKANALLDEGLAEIGKYRKDMEASFTIHCVDSDGGKKGAQVIQQMWKDNLGIEVSLTPLQVSMLMPVLQDQSYFVVVGGGRGAEFDDPEDFVTFLYIENKMAEYPEFNETVEKIKVAQGDERLDLIAKAEQLALDSYLLVPQTFRTQTSTYNDKLVNFEVTAFAPRFDLMNVYFTK